ncbi:MAG: methionine biosynthesis MetW family protein [uncultured bacterium]|nr:MAG: methionine biosynthesis MetW family protein [uncultured bacterium]HBH17480.1 methionine biosynthesis protein MetW [Cyanobacteria bacterium UBA9579]
MLDHYKTSKGLHLNYSIISDFIELGSKVLDLGCGAGELLKVLKDKGIQGSGIEINEENVVSCIEKGLSVFQGDIDEGLKEFEDKCFDYVILNQTLQMTHKPDYVIQEMMRVGKKVVISFPNFAYWKVRAQLFFKGKMPKSSILPFEWYDTPNIHLLTIEDFREFCKNKDISVLNEIYMTRASLRKDFICQIFSNILAEEVMFVVKKD